MTTATGAPAAPEENIDASKEEAPATTPVAVTPEAKPAPAAEAAKVEEPAAADAVEGEAKDEPEAGNDDDDTPLSIRKAKELRSEARSLRNKNKAILAENETYKARIAELEASVLAGAKESVKSKFGFNDTQAGLLQGGTVEELEAHAALLAEAFGIKTAPDYSNLKTGKSRKTSSGTTTEGMTKEEKASWVFS